MLLINHPSTCNNTTGTPHSIVKMDFSSPLNQQTESFDSLQQQEMAYQSIMAPPSRVSNRFTETGVDYRTSNDNGNTTVDTIDDGLHLQDESDFVDYKPSFSGCRHFLRGESQKSLNLQDRQPAERPPTLNDMMAQTWNSLSPAARAHYENLAVNEQKLRRLMEQQQQQQPQQAGCHPSNMHQSNTFPHPNTAPQLLQASGNNEDLSFLTPSYRRAIAVLASNLDEESIDFVIRTFK